MEAGFRWLYRASLQPKYVNSSYLCRHCRRNIARGTKVFQEGDNVLLKPVRSTSHEFYINKLRPEKRLESHQGVISHQSILGKRVRDAVQTNRGTEYRLAEPTLDEYVRLTPRLVTPIYSGDANLIVSLLDIHVPPPTLDAPEGSKLEILEAGTGHGSLTLHLARAIHAANSHLQQGAERHEEGTSASDSALESEAHQRPSNHQPDTRRAVIHTIEAKAKYSKHAKGIVRGFRNGMYAKHVDFHVGDVTAWLKEETEKRQQPFLSYAFLDLPSPEHHVEAVARALLPDGMLMVFTPSVTQIADVMLDQRTKQPRMKHLGFSFEKVVELQSNISLGREWSMGYFIPRANRTSERETTPVPGSVVEGTSSGSSSAAEEAQGAAEADSKGPDSIGEDATRAEREPPEWKLICRPKPGEAIVGGGFLGLWKKNRTDSEEA